MGKRENEMTNKEKKGRKAQLILFELLSAKIESREPTLRDHYFQTFLTLNENCSRKKVQALEHN